MKRFKTLSNNILDIKKIKFFQTSNIYQHIEIVFVLKIYFQISNLIYQ